MPYLDGDNPDLTDRELIEQLARWLRKHDCGAFGHEDGLREETRTIDLLDWFATVVGLAPNRAHGGGR